MADHLLTTWETWHGAPIQLYLLDGDDATTWQQWHGEPLAMGIPESVSIPVTQTVSVITAGPRPSRSRNQRWWETRRGRAQIAAIMAMLNTEE